ncbi:MAG: hypothetical protein VZR73_00310 [Acutalibacteraceae bacterium]|nr:hypothetical protein [Acutalibacteraceae bacterium]
MGTTYKGIDNKGKVVILPNTFSVNGMTFMCENDGFILKQSDDGLTALRGNITRVVGWGVGRCTGLKDKNDRDIYENYFLVVSTSTYLVQYSGGGFVAKGITSGTDDAALTAELAATTLVAGDLGGIPVWAEAEAGTTTLWGHTVSDLQTSVSVNMLLKLISGTLKYVSTGALARDWGAGYFLVLKFTDLIDADKIKVGLEPSVSSGLVALDEDMNAVFKITDKNKQVLVIETYKDADVVRQEFALWNLALQPHA